jgi:TonB family protein
MSEDDARCPVCSEARGAPRGSGIRFATGEIIDDRYEVVGHISEGGMGELYKVRHLHLHDIRAIKILRPGRLGDEAARQRFLREARIAASIKHPNVALLHDFAMLPDKSWYMVEEFIEGTTLARSIRSGRRFSLNEIVEIAKQILLGLGAIHDCGIVHRDISPDNVMLADSPDGAIRVKIIDLGIARPIEATEAQAITSAGLFIGKPRYASPEQMRLLEDDDAPIDHRTDLYSLGVVLYEIVSGKVSADSSTPFNLLMMQLAGEPFAIDRTVADLMPPDLERFITTLLQARREARFQSTVEALRAVARIKVGAPTLNQNAMPEADEGFSPSGRSPTSRRSQTAEVPVEQLKRLIEQDRPDNTLEPAIPPRDHGPRDVVEESSDDDFDDSRKTTLLQTAVPEPLPPAPPLDTSQADPPPVGDDEPEPVAFVPEISREPAPPEEIAASQPRADAEIDALAPLATKRRSHNPLVWFAAGIAFVAFVVVGGYLFYRWLDARFGERGESPAPIPAAAPATENAPSASGRADAAGSVGADGATPRQVPPEPAPAEIAPVAAAPVPSASTRDEPPPARLPESTRAAVARRPTNAPAASIEPADPDASAAPEVVAEPAVEATATADDVREGDLVAQGPGVVAPTVLRAIEPIYPPLSANMGREGTVMFSVLVAPDGTVEVVKLIVSSGSAPLDRSAEDAARRTVFTPATRNGVKVRMWKTLRFEFRKTRGF